MMKSTNERTGGGLSWVCLILGALLATAAADEGATRQTSGAGRFAGFNEPNALAISAGPVESISLDASGACARIPALTDGVNVWSFINGGFGLQSDGSLAAEGVFQQFGGGVTDAVDASITFNSLAVLNSDATAEGFGQVFQNQLNPFPQGLGQVVDFEIGFNIAVAVMADGTVQQWGNAPEPPAGLSEVVEVHCGDHSAIALLADGSVVTWGSGNATAGLPAGLTGVSSVHAGMRGESYAVILGDSTMISWPSTQLDGTGIVGTALGSVPPDQTVITEPNALPCARLMPLASSKDPGSPHLIKVHRYAPVASYQWRLDGVDLPGETKPYLYLDSVGFANQGDYTVAMINPNGTVETAASTLTINREPQTIEFQAVGSKSFGDPDFDLAATASSGLPVSFSLVSGPATIDGSTVTITGAGTLVVRAEQAGDAQYEPAAPVDLTITVLKLDALVTLSELDHVYDGTPKSAVATTDPGGLPVLITYGGNPSAPSDGGEYAVVASIDDPNYRGTDSGTLVIARAAQAITFEPLGVAVFGDPPVDLAASSDSGLPVSFTVVSGAGSIDGSTLTITGAGQITVSAQQAGDGNYEPATPVEQALAVTRASQTIDFPAIGTLQFGIPDFLPPASATSELPITLEVLSGPATASGASLSLTGAGSVTVRASQAGDPNWSPAAPVEQTFTVEKGEQSIEFVAIGDRIFDSGDFELEASSTSQLPVEFSVVEGPATVAGSTLTMTGAGTVTVRASQAGDDDYLAATDVDRSFLAGYSLTLAPGEGGSASADPEKPIYTPGETVTLSVQEDPLFRFTGWGGDLTGTDDPAQIVMDANQQITVGFKRIWELGVDSSAGGSVSVSPAKDEYLEGDEVTLTPVPDTGYELEEWQGDATGQDDPLVITMGEDTSIFAQFTDVDAPAVTIFSPAAGTTNNQFTALFGMVTDNDEVVALRWERDGADQGTLPVNPGGTFSVTNLVLGTGANQFKVFALDPTGNEGEGEVIINWRPDRTLSLSDPPEVREGKLVTVPINLESLGNVGGMTFVISYDETFLSDPEVALAGPVAGGINQINTDTPGEVRVTFALPATTLPAGELELGDVTFRARSVPFSLSTQFDLEVTDVAGSDGNQIPFGTHTVGASGRILQRQVTGDINTNGRLDTGDAFRMQRLLAGLDEIRSWDHVLNDLNNSALVDSGDVIRVLRTVVGIDPQPEGPQAGQRSVRSRTRKSNGTGPRATLIADQLYGFDGDEITVQVRLDGLGYAPSGASFTLDYPVEALRLTDASSHTQGGMVPDASLVLWNVAPSQNDYANQSGSISFVTSSGAAWPGAQAGGVLAEFVFKVQPGAASEAFWPIGIRSVEVPSEDGFDILSLASSQVEFLGQATTYASWLELHFSEAEIADENITGLGADPNGNGLSNLEEYGMGLDPASVTTPDHLTAEIVGDSAAIGFRRSLTAIDLDFRVGVSGDLASWEHDEEGAAVTEIHSATRAEDGRSEWLIFRDLSGTLAAGPRFLRVEFSLAEP